jgi:hypothetical protein
MLIFNNRLLTAAFLGKLPRKSLLGRGNREYRAEGHSWQKEWVILLF